MKKNTFANAVKLPERVAVYVPGTCGVDAITDTSAWTDAAASALSEMFGGATVVEASGCWMSDAAGLVKEPVKIVYAYGSPEDIEAHADDLRDLAERIKSALNQEAVSVEYRGALYLV